MANSSTPYERLSPREAASVQGRELRIVSRFDARRTHALLNLAINAYRKAHKVA